MQCKKIILSFALIWMSISGPIQAQSDGNSPFSRLGIGDLQDPNFVAVSLLGGLSASYRDPYRVNIANPASLGHLRATAFEFSLFGRRNSLSENALRDNFWDGNIGYFSLAFPLINPINELIENKERKLKWGAQIALLPFSRVQYNISSSRYNPSVGTVRQTFTGSGNTYKLLMNHGLKWKSTAVGLSTGLFLGTLGITSQIQPVDIIGAQIARISNKYSVSGFVWNFGVLHDIEFMSEDEKKNILDIKVPRITIGATFQGNRHFRTQSDIQVLSVSPQRTDTLFNIMDNMGQGTLPLEMNLGLMYNSGKNWTIGVNYHFAQWSNYSNDAQKSYEGQERFPPLKDAWKASMGFSIVPNPNAFKNILNRSKYVFGLFYTKDPRVFSDTQLQHYGLTAGIELPFIRPRNFSFINLGVELGRSDLKDALQNNYLKIHLGLTFNSNQWFLKRKYN